MIEDRNAATPERGAIHIERVSKRYGEGRRALLALGETTLEVAPGEFVSIVGPSGCGKTTLLKTLGDVLGPSTGIVEIDGEPASVTRRQRRIGFVFQNPVLLPWRTVRDNLSLPFEVARGGSRRKARSECHVLVEAALSSVGLSDFADRYPRELSGGMQSRVSLARAMITEPAVLLMDEPFAALDELTRTDMALHLLDLWERVRTTVVFVTHHIQEAVLLSSRILVMSPRPGIIRRDITVNLPRPRSLEVRSLPAFRDLVEDLVLDFHGHSFNGEPDASEFVEGGLSRATDH
jgi:NitT/TauT family transport system ATP-binding protein